MRPTHWANWIRITLYSLHSISVMMVCCVLQEYCDVNENLLISVSIASWCHFFLSLFLFLPTPVPRSLHLRVIHPSSPSAHPIIKSFSCCFAKCHVNLSCAPLPSRSSSPPCLLFIHSSLYISNVKTWGNVSLSRWHCYLWCIAIHSAGLSVLASANLIHNFIHLGHYFEVTGQKWLRQTPFFFITESWHLSVHERGRESASTWFMPCYQWLLNLYCSFDVIF